MALQLQLKRNASIYDGKDAAVEGLSEALKNGANGEVMIAIYNDVNPYVTEIPLYNTNGGDTYIDWFNENSYDSIDINDKFRVQFEGEWPSGSQCIYNGNSYNTLFSNESVSGWFYINLPMHTILEGGVSNTLRTFDITYGLNLSNTADPLNARYDYCYCNGESISMSIRLYINSIAQLYQSLDQLHSSQEARDNGARTDFFSLTYLPAKKILKTDLYADTTNYSDIQYV